MKHISTLFHLKALVFFALCLLSSTHFYSQELSDQKAQEAMKQGDYKRATVLYTDLINANIPDDVRSVFYYGRAFCLYSLNLFEQTLDDLKKSEKIKPSNPQYDYIRGNTFWMYGRVYSKLGDRKKSLKYLKKAVPHVEGVKAHAKSIYTTIGYEELALEKYADALIHLTKAIELDSSDAAYAYSNRAAVYLKLGDPVKARADIIKSVSLNPDNPYVYKHSALIYIELKEYAAACEELNKAKELGYADFGKESDANEVDKLIERYCKSR